MGFTGDIELNSVYVSAAGLPDSASTTLASGTPVTVLVSVRNNGNSPELLFLDSRLTTTSTYSLSSVGNSNLAVPLPNNGPPSGDPDIASAGFGGGSLCSTNSEASFSPSGGSVTPGLWTSNPAECGPYATAGASRTATDSINVQTLAFDSANTTPTGDCWMEATNPSSSCTPVEVEPGQPVTINLTDHAKFGFRNGHCRQHLLGHIRPEHRPARMQSGDQMAAIPYEYTVGD